MIHRLQTSWARLVQAEDSLDGRERALLDLVFIDWLLVAVMVAPTSKHVSLPPVVSEVATYLAIGMVTTTVALPLVAEVLDR
ncbi:hypothetical protein E6P09_09590 [Haloferax mediterranei ATCC 33500]|uniref:Uncharacterized protein n=1 Tax=Haloferax mediterranei (strain ATCC 33500 / DSM 1411 / JCM 8866 / NBRC 14739 / NCIMB 2177 / R-4) TaxID=523841 RepID=I3R467_HALMT|nr:hypothetical protein [Haloferax mediterranei]AFK19027.1 hypothetical protein HFX_1315 [Haloferax mediterranei ATCC 33500]AHZ21613.1 hypothetical protein BM92_02605 [Haloferax mediterranei ATCC 33500]MDX5989121.1 hypothetical protein [Haloferax mediterranei ATCC 33500]QCQ75503.1 hypothetical protein E6P09_09590 [Haloferax mediterranei ATCC 33500]